MPDMPVTAHYSPRKIAFIGFGVMGYPMAGHLSNSGHYVSVFNRHSARAEQWCSQFHGKHAASPAEAGHEAELVMLCVGRDEDVREVITSEHGIAAGIGPDAVVVDHTTTSAALAREIADYLRARHAHYIDAPVSGGEQGAINGHLTILCGGEQTIF